MSYFEYAAGAGLSAVVERFWSFESASTAIERIAPDGRCELIIHMGEPYLEVHGAQARVQPPALLAGQLTQPLMLQGQGRSSVLSARLAPAAAAMLLHGDARQATNRRLSLLALDPQGAAPLLQALAPAQAMESRVARLASYIGHRCLAAPLGLDAVVERALIAIETEPAPPLSVLAGQLGLSLRQLERRFAHAVGLTPRQHLGIVRFRRIFDALDAGASSFSAAAQSAGYSDHPQMAREFRRYLGCTASQFIAQRAHLAAAMTGAAGMSH